MVPLLENIVSEMKDVKDVLNEQHKKIFKQSSLTRVEQDRGDTRIESYSAKVKNNKKEVLLVRPKANTDSKIVRNGIVEKSLTAVGLLDEIKWYTNEIKYEVLAITEARITTDIEAIEDNEIKMRVMIQSDVTLTQEAQVVSYVT
ncbi:hypothetical protein HHI36_000676 [Cryptolaemus montrouzieri]|uniref:Uncharacterized protein n=1 Tax=Cryptolaemus montrouzieri TaxID=559131 RepID=A0ABD2P5S7_9CUCU